MGLSSLPLPSLVRKEMLCLALTFSETVYHFRQQLLVHCYLWYPFPPIKAQREGLHLNHLQSLAEWLKPCRVLAHTLWHKLSPRRSCLGARTPLLRKRRWMAANACDTVPISCTRLWSAPGADALLRRCMSRACQLRSLPATPRERQAGSLTGMCSRPQARRRRAIGHACGCRSSARASAS